MEIFNFLKYTATERLILNQYTDLFSMTLGYDKSAAKKMATEMIDTAIKEAKDENTYFLPSGILGDMILGGYKDNSIVGVLVKYVCKTLPIKRKDGVRDEDIQWWWNLDDISRRMVIEFDAISKMASFISDREDNKLSVKKSGENSRKYSPIYGDPNDLSHSKGDDRPLPWELKDRINIYIENMIGEGIEKSRPKVEKSTSFNSLIRKEIRNGKI